MSTRPSPLVSTLALALGLALPASARAQAQVSAPGGSESAAPPVAVSLQEAAAAAGERAAAQTPSTPQPVAPAPEKAKIPVTGGANFDFFSHYVWRGFVLTDAFSFQPSVWAKVGDLMVSSWSSWAEGQDGGPLMEHDLTVDYSKAVGKVTYSVGYINYLFPAIDEGSVTNEIYVGTAFATLLNPTVKAYFDVHEGSGTYVNFGISHPLVVAPKLTITPAFAIGYNHEQWIDESAWNDANFGLKFTIPISSHFTLGPGIFYSKGLNDAIPDKFYGGVSVMTTF
jgi:hypothetical protein